MMSARIATRNLSKQFKPLLVTSSVLNTDSPGTSKYMYSQNQNLRYNSITPKTNQRLIEVGRMTEEQDSAYLSGQVFLHKSLGYRGIILYSWTARMYEKPINNSQLSSTSDRSEDGRLDGFLPDQIAGIKPIDNYKERPTGEQLCYKVLVHDDDWPHIVSGCSCSFVADARMPPDEGLSVLVPRIRSESGDKVVPQKGLTLHTIPGVDFVIHDDVMPLATGIPIKHKLFDQFFYSPKPGAGFHEKERLSEWWSRFRRDLQFTSAVCRETTENIRVTVIPLYIGCRYPQDDSHEARHYWRYWVRLENLGNESVTLHERHLRICSFHEGAATKVERSSGKGVVNHHPQLTPANRVFQYSCHIELSAPEGRMWGEYVMLRDSFVPEDELPDIHVRIPGFPLISSSAVVSPSPTDGDGLTPNNLHQPPPP